MKPDGTGQRRITSDPGAEDEPAVSPDGRTVAFRRMDGANSELFVAMIDGGDEHPLAPSPAYDTAPAFSPDGRRVTFAKCATARSRSTSSRPRAGPRAGSLRRREQRRADLHARRPLRALHQGRLGGFDFLQVPLDGSRVPRVWWTGPRPHPRPPASAASFTANGPSR